MMQAELPSVSVIIAAWNAEATIGRAVASALIQPEVSAVIVVDDGSTDGTVAVARAVDDGGNRVQIVALAGNRGPAAARNAGLDASVSPFVALLDADDFFVPNRFAALFAVPGWDAIADNIAFVTEDALPDFRLSDVSLRDAPPERLTLADFVTRNISRRGHARRELGFAKPVMRRAFLLGAGLAYDETLRLGEDFALYTSMLVRGANFLTIARCGYVAVERASSLSGQHRTADLVALLAFDRKLEATPALPAPARTAIRRHRAHLAVKVDHRRFLDTKREQGLAGALSSMRPSAWPWVIYAVARDKLAPIPARPAGVAYLF
ncbi:glycosyltransferase family 2 protein [Sphingomonas sp. M1A8_2b]